jgi:SAM-dependent methyltransferase
VTLPDAIVARVAHNDVRFPAALESMPGAIFNRAMEALLEKEDPDKVVAWPAKPIPAWARTFRPHVFLDLGCGLGAVTTSVLRRLAHWGCLATLREVVVVDNDVGLHNGGGPGLKAYLEQRIGHVLAELGILNVSVRAEIETLRVISSNRGDEPDLAPLERICPRADLILASHVTYYFGDGSGRELVTALAGHRLSDRGLIWVDVRDLDCPVYRARQRLLETFGINEPRPFDYAEHFEAHVIGQVPKLALVDRRRVEVAARPGSDAALAARLMMWRGDVSGDSLREKAMFDAATLVAKTAPHLYSETQFVLSKSKSWC